MNMNRIKIYVDGEHPTPGEGDYADFFETAGAPVPNEASRMDDAFASAPDDADDASDAEDNSVTPEAAVAEPRAPTADTPALGLFAPSAPVRTGRRALCHLCHKPKRNHKCQGRYIPQRQYQLRANASD